MRRLEQDVAEIEGQLKELRAGVASLQARAEKLEAITGVGTVTALGVLAELPELGTLNRQQAAVLGFDVMFVEPDRSSGLERLRHP